MRPNLELKTQPKLLLGYLPLIIALPVIAKMSGAESNFSCTDNETVNECLQCNYLKMSINRKRERKLILKHGKANFFKLLRIKYIFKLNKSI